MPGTEVLVQIALGLAVMGGALWVLRWAWNSRKNEGSTAERVAAFTKALFNTEAREKRVRKQESQSHAAWKKAGIARRRKRKP